MKYDIKLFNQTSNSSNTVHDFESIITLLRNRLNWPIPDDGSGFEDMTYYWSPENLDLDANTERRIIGCWQLRLLNLRFLGSQQPWGIFIVQFKNDVRIDKSKTLMVRVLRGLVDRRGRDVSLPFWKRDRVLFVCTTANFQDFGFVHFKGMKNDPIFCGCPPLDEFKLKPTRNFYHLRKSGSVHRSV